MRRVLPLIAALSLAFAPAPFPKPKPPSDDLKAMQGQWILVAGHSGSRGRLKIGPGGAPLKITGNIMTHFYSEKEAQIFLDSKQTPPWITLQANDGKTNHLPGIYKIEGDTLTICWGHFRWGRPTNFAIPTATSDLLLRYKRKKP